MLRGGALNQTPKESVRGDAQKGDRENADEDAVGFGKLRGFADEKTETGGGGNKFRAHQGSPAVAEPQSYAR